MAAGLQPAEHNNDKWINKITNKQTKNNNSVGKHMFGHVEFSFSLKFYKKKKKKRKLILQKVSIKNFQKNSYKKWIPIKSMWYLKNRSSILFNWRMP